MRRLLRTLAVLVCAVCLGLAARQWVISPVRVAGNSMRETLLNGDIALVTRWDFWTGGRPERGDVVECAFPGRDGAYVKRVIGLPGETVEFSGGALWVDGRPVSEPYVSSWTEDFRMELGEDEYFVLGDNREESYDSRAADMGCIHSDDLLGRVRWILWPLSRFGPVE